MMKKVALEVEQGMEVSTEAIQKFERILDSMQTTPQIEEIAATSQQITAGVQEVGAVSSELASIASSNATTSEECSGLIGGAVGFNGGDISFFKKFVKYGRTSATSDPAVQILGSREAPFTLGLVILWNFLACISKGKCYKRRDVVEIRQYPQLNKGGSRNMI